MNFTKEQVLGVIRHVLTFAGGILVMRGYVENGLYEELTGAFVTLVGGIWSIIAKIKSNQEPA